LISANYFIMENEEHRFPVLLRTAWFSLNKSFRELLRETGLTPVQFTILRWLSEHKKSSLSQRDLAELTASNQNNIADLMDRLEALNLIERERDESDSRRKITSLTPRGETVYEHSRVLALELQMKAMSCFPKDQSNRLLDTLTRVNENLRGNS
jgi:DNA-binding MarR family transcriptional regulator